MRERSPEERELLEQINRLDIGNPIDERKWQEFISLANKLESLLLKPIKIGYLSGPFERGEVSQDFLDKLQYTEQSQRTKIGSMGHHTCEYCFPGGDNQILQMVANGEVDQSIWQEVTSSGENEVETENFYYRWPDMLRHYVKTHHYLPPQKFIDDILSYEKKDYNEKEDEIIIPEFPY